MFCPKCGTPVPDAAASCPSCAAPVSHAAPSARSAAVGSAFKDALGAFKSVAGDPVGRLARAFESLGEQRALHAGVALGVVSVAFFLVGGYFMLSPFMREDLFEFLGFGGVVKCLLFAVIPFVGAAFGGFAMRKILGGQGSAGGDAFVAGVSLLPVAFGVLLNGMLGFENAQAMLVVSVVAGCIGILVLFSGYTRVSKLSERAATLAVPIVVVLTLWIVKVIATSVLTGSGPSESPGYRWR